MYRDAALSTSTNSTVLHSRSGRGISLNGDADKCGRQPKRQTHERMVTNAFMTDGMPFFLFFLKDGFRKIDFVDFNFDVEEVSTG